MRRNIAQLTPFRFVLDCRPCPDADHIARASATTIRSGLSRRCARCAILPACAARLSAMARRAIGWSRPLARSGLEYQLLKARQLGSPRANCETRWVNQRTGWQSPQLSQQDQLGDWSQSSETSDRDASSLCSRQCPGPPRPQGRRRPRRWPIGSAVRPV
jgi:hypothetical protein